MKNTKNLFISDLNPENINSARGRAERGELHLIEENCFQFDFLNDEMWEGQCEDKSLEVLKEGKKVVDVSKLESKLPKDLLDVIINKPRYLIIFINPPYAEASTPRSRTGTGTNRTGISSKSMIYTKYSDPIGTYPLKELYIQFWSRIYKDIPTCKLGSFSLLKHFSSDKFLTFRK